MQCSAFYVSWCKGNLASCWAKCTDKFSLKENIIIVKNLQPRMINTLLMRLFYKALVLILAMTRVMSGSDWTFEYNICDRAPIKTSLKTRIFRCLQSIFLEKVAVSLMISREVPWLLIVLLLWKITKLKIARPNCYIQSRILLCYP